MELQIHNPQSAPQTAGILGLTAANLSGLIAGTPGDGSGSHAAHKPYRAAQILEWVFRHHADSFDAMSNLPAALRRELSEKLHIFESSVAADSVSTDGTHKLLLCWRDGQTSECVLIPDGQRRTACISTQVGCPVGCVFCASGLDGVQRNLTAAQIVEQAMRISALCADGARLSNVVFMGLGEPLANYDNTVRAARIINASDRLAIGARKITISTVGLPKQMKRLADENLQITLALSLHAPTDDLRSQLIPWAEGVSIADLTDACRYYFDRTHREVTLEYVLLGELNDSPSLARKLAALCKKMRVNVNLIRYNPIAGLPYERPKAEAAQAFLETLRSAGVTTHLRRSRGMDIDGACGQLRRRHESAPSEPSRYTSG